MPDRFHTKPECLLLPIFEPAIDHTHDDLHAYYCKTHQVKCCRCGWEFGHHFGTELRITDEYDDMLFKAVTQAFHLEEKSIPVCTRKVWHDRFDRLFRSGYQFKEIIEAIPEVSKGLSWPYATVFFRRIRTEIVHKQK